MKYFYSAVLTFRLTVVIAAVFARHCRRTAGSAATYRPFVDVLVTLFTGNHHDVRLQRSDGTEDFCSSYNYYPAKTDELRSKRNQIQLQLTDEKIVCQSACVK